MRWFFCTYHRKAATTQMDGNLRCLDGDETWANRCTFAGPYSSKEEAENVEHDILAGDLTAMGGLKGERA